MTMARHASETIQEAGNFPRHHPTENSDFAATDSRCESVGHLPDDVCLEPLADFWADRSRWIADMVADNKLPPTARLVGVAIAQHVSAGTGQAWPSQLRLAAAVGIDTRSARRAIADLAKRGWLCIDRQGSRRSNVYHLSFSEMVRDSTERDRDRRTTALAVKEVRRDIARGRMPGDRTPLPSLTGHHCPVRPDMADPVIINRTGNRTSIGLSMVNDRGRNILLPVSDLPAPPVKKTLEMATALFRRSRCALKPNCTRNLYHGFG